MFGPATTAIGLALGTLVSEDLACIAAGLLIARGDVSVWLGVAGCCAGILAGDVGLWGIGRLFGQMSLRWRWLGAHVTSAGGSKLREWLEGHAGAAIIGSRFLPGSRVPLYVMAGVLRMSGERFTGWAALATLLWTPPLVLLSAAFGGTVATRLPWVLTAAALAAVAARWLGSASRRARIGARLARWARWEFWPMWLFYAPVALHIARLAWRYGGITTITAANPGIPDGGTVGESKADILGKLPADSTIPFAPIDTGALDDRMNGLQRSRRAGAGRFRLFSNPTSGSAGPASSS